VTGVPTSAATGGTTADAAPNPILSIIQVNPQFNGGLVENPNTAFNDTNIFCNGLPLPAGEYCHPWPGG